jgi:hypothetical protein
MGHRRLGNAEQDEMIRELMPPNKVKEINDRAADWYALAGERILTEEGVGMEIAGMYNSGQTAQLERAINKEILKWLKDHLVHLGDQRLMASIGNSYAFMPLHYKLAQSLAPDARLQMYSSDGGCYSVVYDQTHNVVFDSFYYFLDGSEPARTRLSSNRDCCRRTRTWTAHGRTSAGASSSRCSATFYAPLGCRQVCLRSCGCL